MRQMTVVACFSELKNDPAMFGHYGGVHRGVCLEYETSQARELYPVEYRDHIPEVSAPQMLEGVEQMIRDFALTKSTHWAREKEWRIVYYPAPFNTHGMVLRKVNIGIGAAGESRQMIKSWCASSQYPSLECCDLRLADGSYELIE